MKKRILSMILAATVIFSAAAFSGCGGNNDYPVEVANFTIEKEPQNIVVLDAEVADIIAYTGYEVKMVGRSDEVDQEYLSIVPSVGNGLAPSVDDIVNLGAEIVFADENIDGSIQVSLEEKGVKVIKMSQADTPKELETNYVTLGKILGGKVTGSNKGADAYNDLIASMDDVRVAATASKQTDVLYTVCYLYSENNELKMILGDTYGDLLLENTGAVNVATLSTEINTVEPDQLKIANPNFIFYDDENTLNMLKADPKLKNLSAIQNGNILCIPFSGMTRQGLTALETLQKMVEFMYPTGEETMNNQPEATVPEKTSVADDYGIKLDGLTVNKKDSNDNVKAIQQRLFDLGYVTDKENVTGYFGDITEQAIKDFQKKNALEESGKADAKTLEALFAKDAVKA